jgi:hypothetical protein
MQTGSYVSVPVLCIPCDSTFTVCLFFLCEQWFFNNHFWGINSSRLLFTHLVRTVRLTFVYYFISYANCSLKGRWSYVGVARRVCAERLDSHGGHGLVFTGFLRPMSKCKTIFYTCQHFIANIFTVAGKRQNMGQIVKTWVKVLGLNDPYERFIE